MNMPASTPLSDDESFASVIESTMSVADATVSFCMRARRRLHERRLRARRAASEEAASAPGLQQNHKQEEEAVENVDDGERGRHGPPS